MHTLYLVCGLPAVGKTSFSCQLAAELGAAFFDSDTVSDTLIQAAHAAAGLDPHDRDSPLYKQTYREPVYETLFALAEQNLAHTDVILAGPFSSELKDKDTWMAELKERFAGHEVVLHHLVISEDERRKRMLERGALRDRAKLGDVT